MSNWNEERSIHKAKKIGQIDAKVTRPSKKRPRPWRVISQPIWKGGKELVIYRGVDEASCLRWIEKYSRSYFMTRQDQSARAHEDALDRVKRRAEALRIVGPKDAA